MSNGYTPPPPYRIVIELRAGRENLRDWARELIWMKRLDGYGDLLQRLYRLYESATDEQKAAVGL